MEFQQLVEELAATHKVMEVQILSDTEKILVRREITVKDLRRSIFTKYGQPNTGEDEYFMYYHDELLDLEMSIEDLDDLVIFSSSQR